MDPYSMTCPQQHNWELHRQEWNGSCGAACLGLLFHNTHSARSNTCSSLGLLNEGCSPSRPNPQARPRWWAPGANHANALSQAEPLTEAQQGALLSALRSWENWLEARETSAPQGFIVYRPAGTGMSFERPAMVKARPRSV